MGRCTETFSSPCMYIIYKCGPVQRIADLWFRAHVLCLSGDLPCSVKCSGHVMSTEALWEDYAWRWIITWELPAEGRLSPSINFQGQTHEVQFTTSGKWNGLLSNRSNTFQCYTIRWVWIILWPGSSVGIATGWTVRGSNPGDGEIFRTRPDRPWGQPSLLYNGYRVFPGGKAAGTWCWPPTPF
jgi:hypothetical protein